MRTLATVLIDEAHRQAWSTRPEVVAEMNPTNPTESSYVKAAATLRERGWQVAVHTSGPITAETLAACDVLVIPHCSTDEWEATTGHGSPRYTAVEKEAIEEWVRAGGGLVLLTEAEQSKYGNSLSDLAARFGVVLHSVEIHDPGARFNEVSGWVLGQPLHDARWDIWAGVRGACWYRAGALSPAPASADEVSIAARSSDTASPAHAGLLALVRADDGRVVVLTDSDLFGDDSIDDLDHHTLWRNLVAWAAVGGGNDPEPAPSPLIADPAWAQLTDAVEALRAVQAKDGSVAETDHQIAETAVAQMVEAITALAVHVPHQNDQLATTVADVKTWAAEGFGVPDFLDSLLAFHPEQLREDGVEHLVVFPMYTQNGNPNRNFEAVVIRTVWPQWIAEIEATAYDNAAFVPIEFVGFTAGYDTHSAVLFPETVAVREVPTFTWGGIFCDREAARFRMVTREAAALTRLALPPDAEMMLDDQHLTQETFILWDLVHDRFHSHGDLPFDPFMIKQRMPYWMYALEELRCDLSTYRETAALQANGVTLAPNVRYAILFDRLFRFPVSGTRVRNYDGLGGQILFAWLHKHGVLNWTDNTLTIDWLQVSASVVDLAGAIDALYREGIDRSRMGHWLAAHEFVASLVPPHPGSVWVQGGQALPTEPREAVNAVLDDEFPLSVFYEALRKKLKPTIDATRGITAAGTASVPL